MEGFLGGQETDGKGCWGFGFFFTGVSVTILLTCLTLSIWSISLKMATL